MSPHPKKVCSKLDTYSASVIFQIGSQPKSTNSAAPDGPLHKQAFIQECVQEFRDKESSLELEWCHHCHERWFKDGGHSVINGQYHCKRCTLALKRVAAGKDQFTLFGKDDLMTPGSYPADCPRLTWIEELLVAPVTSHMSFTPLSSGSLCYKGNCINFPQNNWKLADQLPWLPKDVGILLIKTKDRNLNDKFLEIDRRRVERFLRFVKERNLPGIF